MRRSGSPGTRSAQGVDMHLTDTDARGQTSLARSTIKGADVDIRAVDENGRRGELTLSGTTVRTPGTLTVEASRLLAPVQLTQVDTSHTSEGRDLMWQRAQGEGGSDLTQAAEWMRGRIVGDGTIANPGEGPLSPIAMGWAVGNNASAQGALSAGLLAMAGTVRVATLALDASLTSSAPAVLAEQQRIRLQDIANQFNDKSITPANMTLRLGGRTLKADPMVSDGAPVFVGATDAEIAGYFRQIAGVNAMPQPSANALKQGKTVYSVKMTEGEYAGATITMRNYSESSQATGARWTLDILGNPAGIKAKKAEIKFK